MLFPARPGSLFDSGSIKILPRPPLRQVVNLEKLVTVWSPSHDVAIKMPDALQVLASGAAEKLFVIFPGVFELC